MDFKEIVSVAGKPGLGLVVGKRPTGFIVETLDEAKKRYPTSMTSKVSFLADISMYTYGDDVKLFDVLKSLDTKVKEGLELITKKDSPEVIDRFFKQVVPEYDEERVYQSDILKLVSWYKILVDKIDLQNLNIEESTEVKSNEPVKVSNKPNAPKITKVAKSSAPKGGNKKSGNIKAG